MAATERLSLDVAGRTVSLSSPRKVLFPEAGYTKLDVVQYVLAVADGALRGAGGRPNVMLRFADGIAEPPFWQKRVPATRPEWLETASLRFPSGRTAEEVVPRDAAALVWLANMGCLEWHPHAVRAEALEAPDELRIDLDPVPGVEWPQIQRVARVVREVLSDFKLVGFPKTSGSRGVHVLIRIVPSHDFDTVRRAALAIAREVARRAPDDATAAWWKEERHGVFIDYNQNAKDRTTCSAYSIRPRPEATVSAPVTWDELEACHPLDFTLKTMPRRFAEVGDRHAAIDAVPCALDAVLELVAQQRAQGLDDAPQRRGRTPTQPVIEIGRAEEKADALAGLERWSAKHPDVVTHLKPADVLVDSMRGRYRTWTRIRVNLVHVPEALRPAQAPLDPDYDFTTQWKK